MFNHIRTVWQVFVLAGLVMSAKKKSNFRGRTSYYFLMKD